MLRRAGGTKEKSIFHAAKPFDFEDCILVSIDDASHAACREAVGVSQVSGHRSQSGIFLHLAPKSFLENGKGHVHVLQWGSATIRRVCRSTLQAETLSLQQGAEECERVRQIFYNMKNLAEDVKPTKNYVTAMGHMLCVWQEIWRDAGETVGNPTFTDSVPANRTTYVTWATTKSMIADALTKEMKPEQLDLTTKTGWLQICFDHSTCGKFTDVKWIIVHVNSCFPPLQVSNDLATIDVAQVSNAL